DAVVVPFGPWMVEVVTVLAAWTSAVPLTTGCVLVDAALGAMVPSPLTAAAVCVACEAGSPVPVVPLVVRSVALPAVFVSAGCGCSLHPDRTRATTATAVRTRRMRYSFRPHASQKPHQLGAGGERAGVLNRLERRVGRVVVSLHRTGLGVAR